MKPFALVVIVGALVAAALVLPQESRAGVSVGVSLGVPAPVVAYPAPAYYPPAYYGPAPVYGPGVVVAPGYGWYGHGYHRPWGYYRHPYGHRRW
ncbi:MAG: hypothetical protein ABSE25_14375 [Syntrophorhabdales bacterium]|jgi:hypothetical protein